MYDLGLLSEAKKQMQGQRVTPAARKSLKKRGLQETITAFLRVKRMKGLNYFEQTIRMPNEADKFDLRLRMVKHALVYGVKPA